MYLKQKGVDPKTVNQGQGNDSSSDDSDEDPREINKIRDKYLKPPSKDATAKINVGSDFQAMIPQYAGPYP